MLRNEDQLGITPRLRAYQLQRKRKMIRHLVSKAMLTSSQVKPSCTMQCKHRIVKSLLLLTALLAKELITLDCRKVVNNNYAAFSSFEARNRNESHCSAPLCPPSLFPVQLVD